MKKWLMPLLVLMVSGRVACLVAQPFPLSAQAKRLDPERIAAALEEARETDLDVSMQNAMLYKGLESFQYEEYEDAILYLEEALRMDPSMTAGWEALGWAYVRTDRPEQAFLLWEYFRTLMPEDWMPYNLLAQAAIMQQDWARADAMFRSMLEINPDLFDQRYWFAQNLLRLGFVDEAEKTLRGLIRREPGRLDIQIDLANLVTHKFEFEESSRIWRHINAELPGNPRFLMNQAEMEVRIGEVRTAERLCEEVLATEDVDVIAPAEARRARNLRVNIADFEDTSARSVTRLLELIEKTDDPAERSEQRLRLANRARMRALEDPTSHSPDEILSIIRDAVNDNPFNLEAMVLYAEQGIVAKQYRSAEAAARHVLERFNRNNIRAKDVLFECALQSRRFDDAEQILHDRYAMSDPTDPMRYRAFARVSMARGDYQEALRLIDQMESDAQRGTVLTLLYHGLTESDWIATTSARRLREHMNALLDAGFTFISPSEIPRYAGLRPGESRLTAAEPKPWLARAIDYLVYQVSGYRRFKPDAHADFRQKKPMKVAAVTFDDGLRSSFMLATDVAHYLGVRFGMFVITKPYDDYQPSVAGWEEVRRHVASGAWEIGSHLYGAHEDQPVDRAGRDLRRTLPNRLWLPERNRIESMNEWDARMQREFRLSRQILADELGPLDCPVPMTAYPFGDVGQEASCNLFDLRNPVKSITSEASRTYQLGFVQSVSGYTTVGDNLLMCRRYEPNWNDEGSDVVRAVLETHPVFMARRLRVELAMLMNRPHMANDTLALLRRDGYPEESCRAMARELAAHFRNIPERPERPLSAMTRPASRPDDDDAIAAPVFDPFSETLEADLAVAEQKSKAIASREDYVQTSGDRMEMEDTARVQTGDPSPWLAPSSPFVNGEILNEKANNQFELNGYGLRAGLNINPRTSLSAEWFARTIDQSVRARWNAVTNDMTKVLVRDFDATRTDSRIRASHRLASGATISASIGLVSLDLNYTAENTADLEDEPGSGLFYPSSRDGTLVGDIGVVWHPRNDMRLHVFYAKDVVQSAVKFISTDSIGGEMDWRPFDILHFSTRGQYWSYSDDNALFNMRSSALLEVFPEMGILAGVEGYVVTSSEACDYYWTPYWDQRVMGLMRYRRLHQGYDFELDFRVGFQREDGRPLRRRQDDGLSAATEWGYIWGFRCRYYQSLTDHLSLGIEANVTALREYVDHQLVIGLTAEF